MILATLSRIAIPPILGHLPNFSALGAIALFAGAHIHRKSSAIILVILSVWVGDIFLSKILMNHWMLFYPGFYWQYGSYILITLLGFTLKKKLTAFYLLLNCLFSSVLFFFISNIGTWIGGYLYPMTTDGLITCFIAAIPFFKNTVISNLFFSALLFGSFELINKKYLISSFSICRTNNSNNAFR